MIKNQLEQDYTESEDAKDIRAQIEKPYKDYLDSSKKSLEKSDNPTIEKYRAEVREMIQAGVDEIEFEIEEKVKKQLKVNYIKHNLR